MAKESVTENKAENKTFMERVRSASVKQWVKFGLVMLVILGFLVWSGAWWLLLLIQHLLLLMSRRQSLLMLLLLQALLPRLMYM